MILVLAVFAWSRFREYGSYLVKPLWLVESLIYVVLMLAYLVRLRPTERSRGWREIVIPWIGSALPFSLLYSPPGSWVAGHPTAVTIIFWLMVLSTSLTVWGMWCLRRSFSITVEVRALVRNGPYRWIRHPVYLGEMLSAMAVTLWRLSVPNIILCSLFLGIQLWRARMEERKLVLAIPEYADFARTSRWPVSSRPHE